MLAVGELASVGQVVHITGMTKPLAQKVTIYTNGSTELAEQLKAAVELDIEVDSRLISRLIKGPQKADVTIEFKDGILSKTEAYLVVTLPM